MNVLSLFTGIGGLDLGIRIAVPAARTVCCVERDDYCRRVLLARMSDGSFDPCPIWGDIRTFDGRPWRGAVDLVAGGFPCQDISNAGRREGIGGSRSGLWSEMARIIGEVRPGYVFIENVSALLIRGLDTVLCDLAALGYDAEWGVVSAADVGAPHLRKRVFILARQQAVEDEEMPALWRDVKLHHRGIVPCLLGCGTADMAESQNERHERGGAARGRGNGSTDGNGALADAEGQRRELRSAERGRPGRPAGGSVEPVGYPDAEHARGLSVGTDREPPVHASGAGLLGNPARYLWRTPRNGERDTPDGAGDLPLFPPGPADRDGWAAVLARAPHLEPAVRRVDARFPHRVDRLRACGNSVVPLQAALAFEILAERLGM